MKKRFTGLGGVFFKTRDPEAMKAWYNEHLHLDAGEYGASLNGVISFITSGKEIRLNSGNQRMRGHSKREFHDA